MAEMKIGVKNRDMEVNHDDENVKAMQDFTSPDVLYKELIDSVDEAYDKSVYLVLSATTKYRDLLDIIDIYKEISEFKIIFTKLDETSTYGNLLNVKLYSDAELSYITNGQNVPDDIEIFDTQKIVKNLLGGK